MQKSALEITLVMCKGVTHVGVKTTKAKYATGRKHEDKF